ncbi:hypothetical protein CTI12_AA097560 [Artemisia annua]|uniref:Uncharacterized protein n=1 Tax=Artemisia annua TaxID=35608 RepID=A0A2U1PYE1_ARTAN|nr:hypothetical protein CTI12_AA097560 [Artemisia annua]
MNGSFLVTVLFENVCYLLFITTVMNAQFLCLLAESVDDTVDNPTPQEVVEPTTETTLTPQISFHALTGQLVPSTPKLSGTLNGHSVIVTVGNGDTLGCTSMCQQAPLQFGTTCFPVNLLLLPIYGADLVLGVEWLAGLGLILFDYKELWVTHRVTCYAN